MVPVRTASLPRIVTYCDRLLKTREIQDYPGAVNGLQVENRGTVARIGAAVDASRFTVEMAITQRVDLLVVHHGLFWSPAQPWTGKRYELIRQLIEHNLAVYSSHLPLDAHPKLGNNARLCGALALRRTRPFFVSHGAPIGLVAHHRVAREELKRRLESATGCPAHLIPGGAKICSRIGVVTGGAGSELKQAAAEGIDTFITGEGPHWTFALAEELGMNVLYGGHYATETFGVKALAEHLSRRFGLPWVFLDHPTGL